MSRIHFFIPIPIGFLLLLPLFVIGLVAALVQGLIQMPWTWWFIIAGAFAVCYGLYALAVYGCHGAWPWQVDVDPVDNDPTRPKTLTEARYPGRA